MEEVQDCMGRRQPPDKRLKDIQFFSGPGPKRNIQEVQARKTYGGGANLPRLGFKHSVVQHILSAAPAEAAGRSQELHGLLGVKIDLASFV